jgi:hypothetical protein
MTIINFDNCVNDNLQDAEVYAPVLKAASPVLKAASKASFVKSSTTTDRFRIRHPPFGLGRGNGFLAPNRTFLSRRPNAMVKGEAPFCDF